MRADEHTPDLLDETISEIASILARGYMQFRKCRQLDSASDNQANDASRIESEPLTEKGLDSSGPPKPSFRRLETVIGRLEGKTFKCSWHCQGSFNFEMHWRWNTGELRPQAPISLRSY